MQLIHTLADLNWIFSFPEFCKLFGHFKAGILRFSNNHWEGRTFSHTIQFRICRYPNEDILRELHCTSSNGKWMHGYTEFVNSRLYYFHLWFSIRAAIYSGKG